LFQTNQTKFNLMIKKYSIYAFIISISILIYACSEDNDDNYEPVSPVTVDLTQVPYPKLSDYKFFEGEIKNQIPSLDVIPYEPASILFSDYAHKKTICLDAKRNSRYLSRR